MWFVEWVDSTSDCTTAWNDRAETVEALATMPEKDMLCKTCGFLLYEDAHVVCLTLSYHATEVGAYIIIPVECIRHSYALRRTA
jgi:hypothetical protein